MGSATVRSQEHIPEGRTPGGLPYVGGLDGLRAFAVVAVLLYHAGVAAVPGGFLGVDVFFVLSGYLITSLLLAERERTGRIDLLRFWARRARRLLPAAVLVVVASVAAIAILHPREAGPLRGDAIASLFYVNNWHQILAERSYFDAFERPSLLQHLWSLAVEEQFYLLWPLALGACLSALGRGRTVAVTLVAGVCSAVFMAFLFQPGTDPSRVYYGTDTHAVGLLVGALLAFAWPLRPLVSVPRRRAAAALDAGAALAGAAVLIAMLTWQDYDPWVYRGGIAVVSIATAVLVAAIAHPASRAGRWLGVAPLLWIGRRSYGIYLWHWPVMALTRPGLDVDASPWLVVPLQFAADVRARGGVVQVGRAAVPHPHRPARAARLARPALAAPAAGRRADRAGRRGRRAAGAAELEPARPAGAAARAGADRRRPHPADDPRARGRQRAAAGRRRLGDAGRGAAPAALRRRRRGGRALPG